MFSDAALLHKLVSTGKRADVNGMKCFRNVVFSSYFRKEIPTGGVLWQVKLVICYWPNTGHRVANGIIPLQLRGRDSNKTREQR